MRPSALWFCVLPAAVLLRCPPALAADEKPAAAYEAKLAKVRGLLEEACKAAGCDLRSVGYTARDLSMMRDGFRLERFDAHIGDPLCFKVHCDSVAAGLRASVTDPLQAFGLLCRLNDTAFWLAGLPAAAGGEDPKGYCIAGFRELWAAAGADLSGDPEKAVSETVAGLPPELADLLGMFLHAAARAARNMSAALKAAGAADVSALLMKRDTGWSDEETGIFRQDMYEFSKRFDTGTALFSAKSVVEAAVALKSALEAAKKTAVPEKPLPVFSIDTPLGRIVFSGPGNDSHEAGRYLLIVDWGGDDTYGHGAGGADFGQYASVCIDLSGNDRYTSGEGAPPSFGAGFLGTGVLIDCAGNDAYESSGRAQGYACFGTGILLDGSGDDSYTIDDTGQGAASFGVAALLDAAGNDTYTCFFLSQGVGLVRGVGALVDGAGNDTYTARDDKIVRPSPQSREHNSSLSQGVGFGRRADMSDGHNASGGVGILVDAAGDDKYSGGVMAQAHGYWYGTGILVDYDGNDSYKAAWYGQSTSAHFGLSYFRDVKGNDVYDTLISQNLGNGRDMSLSFFQDDEGDDAYRVVDRGAGCGNINGIGIFIDLAGNDRYAINAAGSMGIAILEVESGPRREIRTFGLFVDAEGSDVYDFKDEKLKVEAMRDGGNWVKTSGGREFSAGIDR